MGFSLSSSTWFTREGSQDNRMKKTLYALTAGAMLGDAIVNVELVRFKETHPLGANISPPSGLKEATLIY